MPFGSMDVLRASAAFAFAMGMLKLAVALSPEASCTCALKAEVPAAVGMPEITPAAERLRPAGNEPERTVNV